MVSVASAAANTDVVGVKHERHRQHVVEHRPRQREQRERVRIVVVAQREERHRVWQSW
jgi:hypothetical protein